MNFLWLIPSAAMTLFWGISTGSWQYPLMSLSSIAISLVMQRSRVGRNPLGDADMAAFSVSLSDGRWHIGHRRLPRFRLFWRRRERTRVFAEIELMAQANAASDEFSARAADGFASKSGPAPAVWLGRCEPAGDLELSLARDGPHLLVVGPTGSGKSRLLSLLVTSLAGATRLDWMFFDFKGGATLGSFAESLGVPLATDLDLDFAASQLASITEVLERRERALADARLAHYLEFNDSGLQRKSMRPVPVVIDELTALLRLVPSAQAVLESVVARGRSLGVHLVAANQGTSGLSRSLLSNMRQRVVLAGIDPVDAVQLGFGSTPQIGTKQAGWGSGAIFDSAERTARAFRFPLSLETD